MDTIRQGPGSSAPGRGTVVCRMPFAAVALARAVESNEAGDIITHSFEKVTERMPVVDDQGALRPFVLEAKARGVLFDVGHGGYGFWFSQAFPALKQGLAPNSFGTDLPPVQHECGNEKHVERDVEIYGHGHDH